MNNKDNKFIDNNKSYAFWEYEKYKVRKPYTNNQNWKLINNHMYLKMLTSYICLF